MASPRFSKPSPGLVTEFRAVLEQLPQAEPRKMFGYDAAFVNGNMAVGLWQNTCVLKLSEADREKLLKRGLATPFAPMPGRVMGGWVELSEELAHDPEELLAWSARAVDHAATLPPKLKRAKAKGAGPTKPEKPARDAKVTKSAKRMKSAQSAAAKRSQPARPRATKSRPAR